MCSNQQYFTLTEGPHSGYPPRCLTFSSYIKLFHWLTKKITTHNSSEPNHMYFLTRLSKNLVDEQKRVWDVKPIKRNNGAGFVCLFIYKDLLCPLNENAVSCSGWSEVMGRASANMCRASNVWGNILRAPLCQQLQYVRPSLKVSSCSLSSFVEWSCGPLSQTSRTLPSASFFHLTILLLPLSRQRKLALLSLFSWLTPFCCRRLVHHHPL